MSEKRGRKGYRCLVKMVDADARVFEDVSVGVRHRVDSAEILIASVVLASRSLLSCVASARRSALGYGPGFVAKAILDISPRCGRDRVPANRFGWKLFRSKPMRLWLCTPPRRMERSEQTRFDECFLLLK